MFSIPASAIVKKVTGLNFYDVHIVCPFEAWADSGSYWQPPDEAVNIKNSVTINSDADVIDIWDFLTDSEIKLINNDLMQFAVSEYYSEA